eukprot:8233228-Pyramimonas_sp.AAC.1
MTVPLFSGLARGLSCPDGYVAECAAAAVAIFVDDPAGEAPPIQLIGLRRGYMSPSLAPSVRGAGICPLLARHWSAARL